VFLGDASVYSSFGIKLRRLKLLKYSAEKPFFRDFMYIFVGAANGN
jgi:hypothetical protein